MSKKLPETVPTPFDLLAQKIDSLFVEEERIIADLGIILFSRLTTALRQETVEAKKDIYILQLNALWTITASIELWRRAFLLQVGILLRNAVETITTAAVLNADRDAYRLYKSGTLNSSKSFTKVKHVWPVVGEVLGMANGFLSDEFTHLGEAYRSWQAVPFNLEERHTLALKQMLTPIKFTFHVLDLLSELTCYDSCPRPRYWKRIQPNAYKYEPTEDAKQWVRQLIGESE